MTIKAHTAAAHAGRLPRSMIGGLLGVSLLALPACGNTRVPQQSLDTVRDGSVGEVAGQQSDVGVPSALPHVQNDSSTPAPHPTVSPTNVGAEASDPQRQGAPLTLSLNPTCVTVGRPLTVTFRAPPQAALTMVIGFSDSQAHGALATARADDSGLYVWRLVIAPDTPPGPAKVLAGTTGANESAEGGGSAEQTFVVVADAADCAQ